MLRLSLTDFLGQTVIVKAFKVWGIIVRDFPSLTKVVLLLGSLHVISDN